MSRSLEAVEEQMTPHEDGAAPRPTLAQVAARAGVSLKTASRALGGESYVSEKTLTSVLAAAAELDYQRNAAASLLASESCSCLFSSTFIISGTR